jgi:hypothetical protein
MTDKKRRNAQGETDEERAYEKALKATYENDAYWLKYLDGRDYETIFVYGEETPEQTRDRRNQAAIRGAYLDARQTRSEEEALAFVLDVIESVKAADRFDKWVREGREKATPDDIAEFGDDLPF